MTTTDPAGFDSEKTGEYAVPVSPLAVLRPDPDRPVPGPVLTQRGLQTLAQFVVAADAAGGVRLDCAACGGAWSLPWPGHVLAPDVRHLVYLAGQHLNEVHA